MGIVWRVLCMENCNGNCHVHRELLGFCLEGALSKFGLVFSLQNQLFYEDVFSESSVSFEMGGQKYPKHCETNI